MEKVIKILSPCGMLGYGFKITILRDVSSRSVGDREVYGAQQHAPIMKIEF
jgi:hypothetical protein